MIYWPSLFLSNIQGHIVVYAHIVKSAMPIETWKHGNGFAKLSKLPMMEL